ncbi:MAG TPA: hypothetical protein VFM53_02760 [Anaeromyxobacteraceae bacterium]|nr:hypothetical protein [Anaeromyxobacteraceae bacterium]
MPGDTPRFPRLLLVATLSVALLASACSSASPGDPQAGDIPDPIFADPVAKIAETGDRTTYSAKLFAQYVHQDPDLVDSARSPEIYLTFFGGANNRGRALAFLDTTNYLGTLQGRTAAKAIWIMGNGNWQYAEYRLTNESERWSDRASQEDPDWGATPLRDEVRFHGKVYRDPHPVTQAQQARIWANYSAAYADMARLFHGSGRTVRARAFAQGARSTSAFWVECQTLRQLVADGQVADFKCAATDFPAYDDPAAWVDCPADCRPPPALAAEGAP